MLQAEQKRQGLKEKSCYGRLTVKSETIRFGMSMEKNLLERCDKSISKTQAKNRSEFISEAVNLYLTYLDMPEQVKVLSPHIESVIDSKIQLTEDRISRLLFKQTIEISMMMNVIAATHEINIDELDALRKTCLDDVRKTNGKLSFKDAVEFQQSG